MKTAVRQVARLIALLVLSVLALQLYFLARVALMVVVDPQSTTFQRSEAWRLLTEQHQVPWSQEWQPYDHMADSLKRAVIASEDASFTEHSGVEWEAVEKAWEKNQRAEARADRINDRLDQRRRPVPRRPAAPSRRSSAARRSRSSSRRTCSLAASAACRARRRSSSSPSCWKACCRSSASSRST
jgi:monofunctional biosynthetic peptidoglycan transglycosylase